MTFGGGALFVTRANFTIDAYSPSGALLNTQNLSNAAVALAYDEASNVLYVLYATPPQIGRYIISGPTKSFVPVNGSASFLDAGQATAMAITPWHELLVVTNSEIQRFDLQLNYKGSYTSAQIQFSTFPGIGGVIWPNGVNEILITDSAVPGIRRYVFNDPQHNTPIANGSIVSGANPTAMVIAP
jgi:hypothetical protein